MGKNKNNESINTFENDFVEVEIIEDDPAPAEEGNAENAVSAVVLGSNDQDDEKASDPCEEETNKDSREDACIDEIDLSEELEDEVILEENEENEYILQVYSVLSFGFGALAILLCGNLFFSFFGFIFAIASLVFAIMALRKKHNSYFVIAGIICSVFGIILNVLLSLALAAIVILIIALFVLGLLFDLLAIIAAIASGVVNNIASVIIVPMII